MENPGETIVEFVELDWDGSHGNFHQKPESVSKISIPPITNIGELRNSGLISHNLNTTKVSVSGNKTTISLDDKEASSFHKGLLSHLNGPKLTKTAAVVKDMTKSSPSSPTGANRENSSQLRQRSYSDSDEKLSAQDKACLEEIEKGLHLTLEDQELFGDLGTNKKFDLDISFMPSDPDESKELEDPSKYQVPVEAIRLPLDKQEHLPSTSINNTSNDTITPNFINNINLNNIDPLESALLQSSIPVSLSHKQIDTSKVTSVASSSHIVVKSENHNQQDKRKIIVQTVPPKQVKALPQNNSVSLPNFTMTNNTAPTIKKVVVHINGSEQVFDVPDFNGEQLTVQPLRIMPSTSEPSMNILLPQTTTLQNGLVVIPVEKDASNKSQTAQSVATSPVGSGQEADSPEKLYVCEECGMAYSKPSKLKIHVMSKHTGYRPYKCSYPGCDWAFTAKYKLQRHEDCHEKKKNGIKEYMCPVAGCGRKFSTTYNVATHMKLHERPLTEECEVCHEKFGTPKELDRHMRMHGEKFKNVKCPFEGCNKLFYSRVSMGSHLQSHQRPSSFPCTFKGCNKVFQQKCKLANHMRHHTNEKPYQCTFVGCSWSFSTSSHLRRHLKSHTNERNYECNKCGKKFLRLDHLKGHMVAHSGEKPFACEFPGCESRFTAKSTMYMHMKKHRHRMVCVCPIEGCHKVFKSKPYLKKHLDQHYGTESMLAEQQGAGKTESESSGLQFINVNLNNESGNINEILQVSPELAQSLLAASAGSMVETHSVLESEATQPITIPGPADSEASAVAASDNTGGSARTDYQRNHMLVSKAKKRHMILKQKAAQAGLDLISVQDINNTSKMVSGSLEGEESALGPVMNPNEVMTSRAITIRDPETGAIYVQTQLLQDDPPNLEFEDVGLEDGSSAEFGDLFEDQNFTESISMNGSEYTVSTINLHDLEGASNT